jgi:hypothetical protein
VDERLIALLAVARYPGGGGFCIPLDQRDRVA